jgi:sugar-specific transcriptional regulator TrmB
VEASGRHPVTKKGVVLTGMASEDDKKLLLENMKQRNLGFYSNDVTTFESVCSSLSKFGFSRNEAMIYIYLSKFGEQKAHKISRTLSLQRTETYKLLAKLEEKGLVYRILGKPIQFVAVQIDRALDNLIHVNKQKIIHLEEEKSKIVDEWFSLTGPAQDRETPADFIQVLKGKHQISAKVNEIIKDAKDGILIAISEENLLQIFLSGSLDDLSKKSRRIKVHLITNSSFKSSYVLKKLKLDQCDLSYMDFEGFPSFIISDSCLLLFLNDDDVKKDKNSRVLLTNQSDIVKILKASFGKLEAQSRSLVVENVLQKE